MRGRSGGRNRISGFWGLWPAVAAAAALSPTLTQAQIKIPAPTPVLPSLSRTDAGCLKDFYAARGSGPHQVFPLDTAIALTGGTAPLNAFVHPPRGLAPDEGKAGSFSTLCSAFQYSFEMFLWLTSPTGSSGERVFESPLFFGLDSPNGQSYTMVQNQPGKVPKLRVRSGKPNDVGELQATGDVLMAQPQDGAKYGSLVYYEIAVNDVYAYFATGAGTVIKAPKGQPLLFPTSQADMDQINRFAQQAGFTYAKVGGDTDQGVLAIELKTAWVEASGVPKGCHYITRTASIPTYDTSNPDKWVPNGSKTTTLALVGMHVVGSALQNPEMLWATFEHVCNSPNAAYSYIDSTGKGAQSPQDTRGSWLFAADGANGPFNVSHIGMSGNNLIGKNGFKISPSDTLRMAPWGLDPSVPEENSIATSINSVIELLAGGDLRRNYVLLGAIWTSNSKSPAPDSSNLFGPRSRLANTTMETYLQTPQQDCFTCHHSKPGVAIDTGMSHVFGSLTPLVPPNNAATAAPSPFSTSTGSGAAAASGGTAQGASLAAAADSLASDASQVQSAATQAGSSVSSAAAAVSAAASSVPQLTSSQPNAAGGFSCTYQVNGASFTRNTQRPACPSTAAAPAKLGAKTSATTSAPGPAAAGSTAVAAVSANAPALVNSAPGASGGLICTYQLSGSTFTRTSHRAQCPATAAAPSGAATKSTPGKSASSGAPAPSSQKTPAPAGEGTLAGSEKKGAELVCTYKVGNKTFTRTTRKSSCPQHAKAP